MKNEKKPPAGRGKGLSLLRENYWIFNAFAFHTTTTVPLN